jgi:very-short-patch-repair endonuclease
MGRDKGRGEKTVAMKQTIIARKLRNNLTEAEKYLWYVLRAENLGYKFRRQAQIGQYFVDFVCYEKNLIIEIDGGQHFQNTKDEARDKWLKFQGYTVLRFWNNEIFVNRDEVVKKIIEYLK